MLREAKDAGWRVSGVLRRRHRFSPGGSRKLTDSELWDVLLEQAKTPVLVGRMADRQYWLYKSRTFWDEDGLAPGDVAALVFERDQRRVRALQRAHQAVRDEGVPRAHRRGPLPRELRRAVWERDGGRCVECGGRFDLQYDHVLPHALGGATTVDNIQLLCQPCNLRKSDSI